VGCVHTRDRKNELLTGGQQRSRATSKAAGARTRDRSVPLAPKGPRGSLSPTRQPHASQPAVPTRATVATRAHVRRTRERGNARNPPDAAMRCGSRGIHRTHVQRGARARIILSNPCNSPRAETVAERSPPKVRMQLCNAREFAGHARGGGVCAALRRKITSRTCCVLVVAILGRILGAEHVGRRPAQRRTRTVGLTAARAR
jgi:hypothetical protein